MTARRRMGTENSETRWRLLDITERLMLQEGYAAVGVRRVAREAEVAPALVLYYFRTLDDLFVAVLRRRAEQELERQNQADDSAPLRSIWEVSSQPGAALLTEFMALANHRKALREELVAHAERYRKTQLEALTRKPAIRKALESGLGRDVPPLALLVATTSIARTIVLENTLGLTYGHAEVESVVEQLIRQLEGDPSADGRSSSRSSDGERDEGPVE